MGWITEPQAWIALVTLLSLDSAPAPCTDNPSSPAV
jgi:hypothetical protein